MSSLFARLYPVFTPSKTRVAHKSTGHFLFSIVLSSFLCPGPAPGTNHPRLSQACGQPCLGALTVGERDAARFSNTVAYGDSGFLCGPDGGGAPTGMSALRPSCLEEGGRPRAKAEAERSQRTAL